jgi:glyoxylase-like metal-dependent hydrolase (beta-lactamase superfamily II)
MLFRQLFDPPTSSYTYLLVDEEAREGVIVDPVREQLERDEKLVRELGITLRYTIETHIHADHVTAAGRLKERFGCRQVVPRRGGPDCAEVKVSEGDVLSFGRCALRAIEVPGHTVGCTAWLGDGFVLTGDALLVRTCGRTDFQGGDPGTLYDSVTTKLFTLPDETVVWPAHDYKGYTSTTIGEEKRHNVRLANRSRDDFIRLMNALNLPVPMRIKEALPANMQCGCDQPAGPDPHTAMAKDGATT